MGFFDGCEDEEIQFVPEGERRGDLVRCRRMDSTRKAVVLVALVAFTACRSVEVPQPSPSDASGEADGGVVDASTDAIEASAFPSAPAAVDAGVEATVPTPALGTVKQIFHTDTIDAHDLVILPDHTFFWEVNGCDFHGGGCGVWVADGTNLVLTAAAPGKSLNWAGVPPATKVTLTPTKSGVLSARIDTVSGPLVQTWIPGQVCAVCGGGLGPTEKPKACSRPLVKACP